MGLRVNSSTGSSILSLQTEHGAVVRESGFGAGSPESAPESITHSLQDLRWVTNSMSLSFLNHKIGLNRELIYKCCDDSKRAR